VHVHEPSFKFCPVCGGDLEARLLKATEPERLVCRRCAFVFYLDPKVAVATIVTDDHGHILLVRRAIEPGYGKWVIPGGYVDRGEEVRVAATRETLEETGIEIRLERLVDIYSYAGRAPVIIVYAAAMTGGCLGCDDEGLEARFFEPDMIPWEELAFRSTTEALQAFLGGPDKVRPTLS
jgi:8-oxo-dGTP diphosphatase